MSDIEVTHVELDEDTREHPEGERTTAVEGDVWLDGSIRHMSVKVGEAVLQLKYNADTAEGAEHGAILLQGAPMLLTEMDATFDDVGAELADEMDPKDKAFLLARVAQLDSDYDDDEEVCGWPNYRILDEEGTKVLEVTFESNGYIPHTDQECPREKLTGRWELTWLGGDKEIIK